MALGLLLGVASARCTGDSDGHLTVTESHNGLELSRGTALSHGGQTVRRRMPRSVSVFGTDGGGPQNAVTARGSGK